MIRLRATPDFLSVGVGESVNFRVESDEPTFWTDPSDKVLWFTGEATSQRVVENLQPGGLERKITFDDTGKFIVYAILQLKNGDPRLGGAMWRPSTLYAQNVQPTSSFMWDPINRERTHVQDANAALVGLRRYISVLTGVGAPLQFDLTVTGQKAWREHCEVLKKYRERLDALWTRVRETDKWVRVPLNVKLRPSGSLQEVQINAYLAHPSDNKRFRVVDWTHPGDEHFNGEYEGTGSDRAQAVQAAIDAWKKGNKYPPGEVFYEVPAHMLASDPVKSSFFATGQNFIGQVSDALEKAGLFLGAVAFILTIAPIPGAQVAAAAMWIAIFSGAIGATGAVLSIAERHMNNRADDTADVLDALNVAACLLGCGGQWVREATQAVRLSQGVREVVLLGDIGGQAFQGVIIAKDAAQEIQQIAADKTLSPDGKLKKLLVTIGKLAITGAMVYVNAKASRDALMRIRNRKPPSPRKPSPSPDPTLDGSPAENLKKLSEPNKKVDVPEDPPQNADTTKGAVHTTTIEAEPPRARVARASFEEAFPPDPDFWKIRDIGDKEIVLQHRIERGNNDALMKFECHISDDGIVRVDNVRTKAWKVNDTGEIYTNPVYGEPLEAQGKATLLRSSFFDGGPCLIAKRLYSMMLDRFEDAAARGGPRIKGASGNFNWDNYKPWKEAVSRGKDPKAAILEDTPSGKIWKEELDRRGYDYEMAPGFPKEDAAQGQVQWQFILKKK